uniref:Uncharacterized protein n=1 Tax=Panagrolaimus sp. ES5 TaxID=591445 RepID=A0AC34FIN8_9BILA
MKLTLILLALFVTLIQGSLFNRPAVKRQVTGDSVVATVGGGLQGVPAGSVVTSPLDPRPGVQTDPFRPSVVSIAGIPGAVQNIPPGSKVVPGK